MCRLIIAPLVIRAILASTFLIHGGQKLMGGMAGLEKFANWLTPMGIPVWLAYTAVFGEVFGGLSVGLGIATELGALVLAVDMAFAIGLAHWSHGYFNQNDGFEYPLNLMLLAIALIISGPAKWYLWDPFTR